MENGLQMFENNNFGNVRVMVDKQGEVWLVGKDVVEILGYDLSGKHVAGEYINKFVDEEDFINYTKETDPCFEGEFNYKVLGQRGGYLINESGLYSLIISSQLPSAKEFKRWVTKEVLPQIRKTGSYMSERDQLLVGLFSSDPLIVASSHKSLVELEKKPLLEEIEHKEDVIGGLVDDIDLATQRQRITQIIRFKSTNYKDRYNLLYKEFELKYHTDLNRRLKSDKTLEIKPKIKNKMDYIDRVMNKIPQLYQLACVVFETDVELLKKEWNDTRE